MNLETQWIWAALRCKTGANEDGQNTVRVLSAVWIVWNMAIDANNETNSKYQ